MVPPTLQSYIANQRAKGLDDETIKESLQGVGWDQATITAAFTPTPHNSTQFTPSPNQPFPDELRKWSWGAFGLGWIWGIGNQVWISLLVFIPFLNIIIGLPLSIYLGICGNRLAWEKDQKKDLTEFMNRQRIWGNWGIAFFIIGIIVALATFGSLMFEGYRNGFQELKYTPPPVTFGTPVIPSGWQSFTYYSNEGADQSAADSVQYTFSYPAEWSSPTTNQGDFFIPGCLPPSSDSKTCLDVTPLINIGTSASDVVTADTAQYPSMQTSSITLASGLSATLETWPAEITTYTEHIVIPDGSASIVLIGTQVSGSAVSPTPTSFQSTAIMKQIAGTLTLNDPYGFSN